MKLLLFIALVLLVSIHVATAFTPFVENQFQPHENKHHVYRSCGETLTRRVAFLCSGGIVRSEVLNALDCCSLGCTDKQLFSWCEFQP